MSAYGNLKNAQRWQKLNERSFFARHREPIMTITLVAIAFGLMWVCIAAFAVAL